MPKMVLDMDGREWSEVGLCHPKRMDPTESFTLFFPTKGENHISQEARRICGECPVERECREYAIETGQEHGIWGGTTGADRRAIRVARRAAARKAARRAASQAGAT